MACDGSTVLVEKNFEGLKSSAYVVWSVGKWKRANQLLQNNGEKWVLIMKTYHKACKFFANLHFFVIKGDFFVDGLSFQRLEAQLRMQEKQQEKVLSKSS